MTSHHWHESYSCLCGSQNWRFDSDGMTGSSYAQCRRCHRRYPFVGAWFDSSLGVMFGSWWSQDLARSAFPSFRTPDVN